MSITDKLNKSLDKYWPILAEPITYRTYTSMSEGDPILGTPAEPQYTDDSTATAIARELTVEEVHVSGGVYVLGDMEFTVRDITEPKYDDRITYGGAAWKPKEINHTWLGEVIFYEIRAGRE